MTRHFSLLIAWGCRFLLLAVPLVALYLLVDQSAFVQLISSSLALPVQWQTVGAAQLYSTWLLMLLHQSVGLTGLYFLSRAFAAFARGERFSPANSRFLRFFSIMLFIQTLSRPVLHAVVSMLLTLKHPPGERMLSLRMGSDEVLMLGVAMILWVTSELLLEGSRLEEENRQFV